MVTPPLVVFSNVADDLAEKELIRDVLQGRPRAITKALQSLIDDMNLIQRRIHETSWGIDCRGLSLALRDSCFGDWNSLQMLFYALRKLRLSKIERKEVKQERIYHFRICAPNLRGHPDSLRLPEMANPAFFTEVSKFI